MLGRIGTDQYLNLIFRFLLYDTNWKTGYSEKLLRLIQEVW